MYDIQYVLRTAKLFAYCVAWWKIKVIEDWTKMDIRKFFKKPHIDAPSTSTKKSSKNENCTDQGQKSERFSVMQMQPVVKFVDNNDIANYINRYLTDNKKTYSNF